MKKRILLIAFTVLSIIALMVPATALAAPPAGTTIQDGVLVYQSEHFLEGEPLKVGYDIFGYNYQARMYRGSYANVYLGRAGFPPYTGDTEAYLVENPEAGSHWAWPYRNDFVEMWWNDAWLSNQDRNNDGLLDRYYGFAGYIGSGAWITNHQSGVNPDGTKWNYFVKIIAVPTDAVRLPDIANVGTWYTFDGTEIGPDIWGEFAVTQEIYNDQSTGDHGVLYKSPAGPGFGKW